MNVDNMNVTNWREWLAKYGLKVHPALDMFPMVNEEELWELAEDIEECGLHSPITVSNKTLLDGRCRLAACRLVGVEPIFEEWDGEGSELAFVLSNFLQMYLGREEIAWARARINRCMAEEQANVKEGGQ